MSEENEKLLEELNKAGEALVVNKNTTQTWVRMEDSHQRDWWECLDFPSITVPDVQMLNILAQQSGGHLEAVEHE